MSLCNSLHPELLYAAYCGNVVSVSQFPLKGFLLKGLFYTNAMGNDVDLSNNDLNHIVNISLELRQTQ